MVLLVGWMMLIKALVAFLLLPGIVVGLIPLLIVLYAPTHYDGFWWGRVPFACGCAILFICVKAFYTEGRGTLAHWNPPKKMITSGCYKYTRNPMYVGVILIIIGESLISGSLWLLGWLAILIVAFNLHIRLIEEPWLARSFPDEWSDYSRLTSRWWPKIPE